MIKKRKKNKTRNRKKETRVACAYRCERVHGRVCVGGQACVQRLVCASLCVGRRTRVCTPHEHQPLIPLVCICGGVGVPVLVDLLLLQLLLSKKKAGKVGPSLHVAHSVPVIVDPTRQAPSLCVTGEGEDRWQ